METRITALEESVAHLVKVVDDLSEVIARQDREIDRLARLLQMIMEREQDSAGSIPLADQKPPHW